MKKKLLWIPLLSLAIVSCTADDGKEMSVNPVKASHGLARYGTEGDGAANPLNPFDAFGKAHNDILDIYFAAGRKDSTLAKVIEGTGMAAEQILEFNFDDSHLPQKAAIAAILDNPSVRLNETLSNSSLSSPAKLSLSSFINGLISLGASSFDIQYSYIVSYESEASASGLLLQEDKRVVLTVATIARHSLYYRKRRKDKDWETSVGNIAAMVEGTLSNSAKGAVMAVATGIAQEGNITE